MLGALIIAPMADRVGRKPIIVIATLMFGLFSLATVRATDVHSLVILRLLTGLGLGGTMPNAIALTSEYVPKRGRSLLVVLMFSGFTLGSIFGGLISAEAIPRYGWQSVFWVGGLIPIALSLLLLLRLPESIRYLVVSKASSRSTASIRRQIDPAGPIPDDVELIVETPSAAPMSVRALFVGGRAKTTILLWTIFFLSLLDVYMLSNWLPTAMNSVGASVKVAVGMGIVLQVGSLIGGLLVGWMLDQQRGRSALSLAPAYALGGVCVALIGALATKSLPLTTLAVFGAGLGVIGGQTAANAVAAGAYPTELRSTGVGWALGVGRLGSILGPLLAGVLIQAHVSIRDVFLISALPALCAIPAALALGGGRKHQDGART